MRTTAALLIACLTIPIAARADVYVKGIRHSETRYHHGNMQPAYDVVHEWWFGEDRVTFIRHGFRNLQGYLIEPALRITLDKKNKLILVVNLSEAWVCEVPWSMELTACIDSSLAEGLKNYQLDGQVDKTDDKKTILQKTCDVHRVSEWMMYGGERFYERKRTVMVTRDFPFDWQILDALYDWIRHFFNPQPSYHSALDEIDGFVMASEDVRQSRGADVRCTFQVLEISHLPAPKGIYDAPPDLTKKETLSGGDLRSIRGMIYTMEW